MRNKLRKKALHNAKGAKMRCFLRLARVFCVKYKFFVYLIGTKAVQFTLYRCRKSRENERVMLNNTKEYTLTRNVDLYEENSFGVTREQNAVKTTFTVCIKADGNGWFTIEGGNEWYAEGGLWFEGKKLVDYDGVFNLASDIVELLENNGYNCDEI